MEAGPALAPSDTPPPPAREFFLPELLRSFPFAYHPRAAQIESASNGWVREIFAKIVADFRGTSDPTDDFAYRRAGKDLWRRIGPRLGTAQVPRFTAGLEAFLRGCATEIHTKLTNRVPDYQTSLGARVDSFGCAAVELLTEYGVAVDMIPQPRTVASPGTGSVLSAAG